MRQALLITILILFSKMTFAQIAVKDVKVDEKQWYEQYMSSQFKTLTLNLSAYDRDFVGVLHNDFFFNKEKISSVIYDAENKIMEIKHNGLIQSRDIYEILNKRGVAKTAIVSYQ